MIHALLAGLAWGVFVSIIARVSLNYRATKEQDQTIADLKEEIATLKEKIDEQT